LIAFVLRLLAILVHGTLFYYLESRRFDGFKTNVAAVQSEKIGVGDFLAARAKHSPKYRSCEIKTHEHAGDLKDWLRRLFSRLGVFPLITKTSGSS
jgi:hypothetical protein